MDRNQLNVLMFNLAVDEDITPLAFGIKWINELAERVNAIDVVTMRKGTYAVSENVTVYSLGKEKGYTEVRRLLRFYRLLFKLTSSRRYDICFSHMNPLFSALGSPLLKPNGTPIVTWYAHRSVTLTLKVAHYLSDRIVTSADNAYQYSNQKVSVIGQGIDTEKFRPVEKTETNPPLILNVGRLSPIKNLETLLKAIQKLKRQGRSVQCKIIGEPPEGEETYKDSLHEQIRNLGISKQVELMGSVPHERVSDWYNRATAHVNCSPRDHSLDKTVLEAMACELPSLTSVKAFKPYLGPHEDVLYFPEGNADALSRNLNTLLDYSSEDQQSIGRFLRDQVLKHHSLENLMDNLIQIFEDELTTKTNGH